MALLCRAGAPPSWPLSGAKQPRGSMVGEAARDTIYSAYITRYMHAVSLLRPSLSITIGFRCRPLSRFYSTVKCL
jgi:hypothetical protein